MSYNSSSRGDFCSPSLSPSLQHLSFITCGVSWQELIIPGQASRDPASSPVQFPLSPRRSLTHRLAVCLLVQVPSEVHGQLLVGPLAAASSCSQFSGGGVIVSPLDPWSSRTSVGPSVPCGYPLQPCCENLESVLGPHLDSPTSWHATFLSHWILCFFIYEARWLNIIVLGLCASVMFKVALFFLKSEQLYYT